MNARLVAAALAVAAAVLFFAVARPLRARAANVGDDYRVARDERRQKREQLLDSERREATVRQALAAISSAPRPPGEAVRQVRRSVVQALDNARLEGVRLSVRPARSSAGAVVRVSASGPVERVLGLTAALAEPGRGVVLENVRLARDRDGLNVALEALGFAGSTRP